MTTAASSRRPSREIPHPPAAPRGGADRGSKKPAAPETARAAASTNGALAVVAAIKPEWTLVAPRPPGRERRVIDYPQATLMKGGREVRLNDHPMRMLAGLGGDVPPPHELPVRIFCDRDQQLVGFQRAEKGDAASWLCTRVKSKAKTATPTWRCGLGKTFSEQETAIPRMARRMVTFGGRIFGFSYAPSAEAAS
jgi:hypothetical protein